MTALLLGIDVGTSLCKAGVVTAEGQTAGLAHVATPWRQVTTGAEIDMVGGQAEDAHEGAGRLLIAGGNGAPLFQPRPEPLHVVAIVVDPLRAGYRSFVLFGRDRRTRAQAPDVLAKGVTAQASVRHHPLRHPGQAPQERDGMGQFMRLARRQDERHRASEPVGDHARLGPIAPTRAAQRFTLIARLAGGPLFSAPAALW